MERLTRFPPYAQTLLIYIHKDFRDTTLESFLPTKEELFRHKVKPFSNYLLTYE
ncbi:hypothetical protein B4082_3005 [Bacillus cereus]|uniref:Uncharacterized protein n=1 Tax=Bacillus cereus TaxID=1396 RepID=A0A161QSZ8_BACCE|nr:hypothetical protein B4082_3005 [Bacillus cereus]